MDIGENVSGGHVAFLPVFPLRDALRFCVRRLRRSPVVP
ncbi:hypothetical protein SRU_2339 [Salinibacter ruber DSM 13855]|uniref:Uncharacterized protein n=1 Tax=Salinibacter ruber (strain DSM 13855 / M31) TaxID=309807 RepID=Q2S041_SALRD|nr:hypothetical protein SRU_2339 [Salinibacter ruber DSM 13855]